MEASEILKGEMKEQEKESYNKDDINWIDNDYYDNVDKVKAHNKKLVSESEDLFFLAKSIDKVVGKPEFFGDHLQTIKLLQKFKVEKKDKNGDITESYHKFFWPDERADKRYDGYPVGCLTKKFMLKKLNYNSEQIILFIPAEMVGLLKNEVSIFEGMKIPMADSAELTKNLKVSKLTEILIVKDIVSTVQILPKEELIQLTKALKENNNFSSEEFLETLQTHPNGQVYPCSEERNLLNAAQKLSGNKDDYPLHVHDVGPAGTGKTTLLEIDQALFEEPMGILEGANSTPKSLEPSFKENPADPGFLSKCNRIASVDEVFKMVQNQINKERQATGSYLGQLNFLLEHKKRTVASGNNNTCTIKTTFKGNFKSNPLTNKPTIHTHIPLIEPSALSRQIVWVQDEAEQELIFEKDRVRNPADTYTTINSYNWYMKKEENRMLLNLCSRSDEGNINPFLTIYDSCQSFVCELDNDKIRDLVKETTNLAREPMKRSVWLPRADHHIYLIIDGLVKFRCLFKDYDPTFTPKDEDYDLAERILVRMVKGWDTNLSPKEGNR